MNYWLCFIFSPKSLYWVLRYIVKTKYPQRKLNLKFYATDTAIASRATFLLILQSIFIYQKQPNEKHSPSSFSATALSHLLTYTSASPFATERTNFNYGPCLFNKKFLLRHDHNSKTRFTSWNTGTYRIL